MAPASSARTLRLDFKRNRSTAKVVVLDNLKRRGSELALERLRRNGVEFAHGDVRVSDDVAAIGPVDLLIEASAEPSVHAGYNGDPSYLIHSNLIGAVNCLEHARRHGSTFVFLSSSRVYPIALLRALPLEQTATRFALALRCELDGGHGSWNFRAVSASRKPFPLWGYETCG